MNNLEKFLSGIAVVIDEKINEVTGDIDDSELSPDPISKVIERIENDWHLPFYRSAEMPDEDTWPHLLKAASFIILDWKLWPTGSSQLERIGIEKHIEFLREAKNNFVPVVIYTNESREEIADKLPNNIYQDKYSQKSFVFIKNKTMPIPSQSLDFNDIENWIKHNASVYALKIWEQAFHKAKEELFSSMYSKSPDWPKVFWQGYKEDSVDPSSSLTNFVNENLMGRMRTDAFEDEFLKTESIDVEKEELRQLIGEASFRPNKTLPDNEIRCGDLFKLSEEGEFLLNLRPDCDSIPRGHTKINSINLYCIRGKTIEDSDCEYYHGQLIEQVSKSIVFSIYEGKTVKFNFRELKIMKFSEVKNQRIGRILHPYITRIQQRYALYLQRQALPRIPKMAFGIEE